MDFSSWPRPPRRLGRDERILFNHVPKTGGTTLHALLRKHFWFWEVCPVVSTDLPVEIPRHELRDYRYLGGHYRLGFALGNYTGRSYWGVTLLRDPVELAISTFHQVWQEPADPLRRTAEERWRTFDEFILDPQAWPILTDPQACAVGINELLWDADLLCRYYQGTPEDREQACAELVRRGAAHSREARLAHCKARIDGCAFVGLTERLDAGVHLLNLVFGWPTGQVVPRLNQSRRGFSRADLSHAVLAQIDRLTSLDRELYDYATRLFERRWQESRELSGFRAAA